jgi:hypothetical protein
MPVDKFGREYELLERPMFIAAGMQTSPQYPHVWFALDELGREWVLWHERDTWELMGPREAQDYRFVSYKREVV